MSHEVYLDIVVASCKSSVVALGCQTGPLLTAAPRRTAAQSLRGASAPFGALPGLMASLPFFFRVFQSDGLCNLQLELAACVLQVTECHCRSLGMVAFRRSFGDRASVDFLGSATEVT
mmetsp:Transcript_36736/g.80549  ORF Transcript_36736/g.80549 Transcript_36736/m.80549 type:complete len:118 (-) Transcript_36736:427-780(-)